MIFDEQIARKPDQYPLSQDFINSMWTSHWTPEEFSFQSDIQDFHVNLSEQEQNIVKKTLSAISQIETQVKKFWAKLGENLPHPSLNDLGYVLANIEVIHNIAYEKLLKVLGLEDIFEENLKLEVISSRVNYLSKYNHKYYKDSKQQYVYSLILFTLFVENISLFSQFYIVLWFGRFKNVLKDTNQQVGYTKNEEVLHAKVGMWLINTIRKEYPELFDKELEQRIYKESYEAFESESKIIDWLLGDFSEESLDKDILKEYIKNRFNDSLQSIGYEKIFIINDELVSKTLWMDEECLANSMTDFFFKRPVEYSKNNKSFDSEELF